MELEIWKDVVGYEGLYQVSNLGRFKSLSRMVHRQKVGSFKSKDKIIKLDKCVTQGYYAINLTLNNKIKRFDVHKLVAMSFLNHIPCGHRLVVNHKDFNRLNNHVNNLEIVTARYNTSHKQSKGVSKYVGVNWDKASNKWRSSIRINGTKKNLGNFINEYDAHLAYQNKLKEITNV